MSAGSRRSRDTTPVLGVAVGLVAVATAFRAWSMRGTWFYYDDFPIVIQAIQRPLSIDSLMEPYLGHLMPAGRLFAWLMTRQEGLDYRPFALWILAAFALAGVGMARLLVTLFGRRWGVLPPLLVFLFSPLLVESTLWWSVAINQLPALGAIVWGLDAHVRFLRGGRTRHLLASLAWFLVGLSFAELALLAYPFVVVLTLAYFARGTMPDRVRMVWREHRRGVLAHAGLIGGYVAVYLHAAPGRFPAGTTHPLLSYFYSMGARAFATSSIGGPLAWRRVWAAQIEVSPSDLVLVLSWAVLGVLVYVAGRSRTRSMRSTSLVLVILTIKVLLLSTGRGVFGPSFALDVRFSYELAPAFALCLALAFMPVSDAVESAQRRQRDPLVDNPRVVAVAVTVFVLLAGVSAARFPLRHLQAESPESYVETLRSSIAHLRGPVQMAPGAVPLYVFGGVEGHYSAFLPMVSDRFVVPKVAIDEVYTTDARGHLVPAELTIVRREDQTRARPTGCPFPTDSGRTRVPLDGPVFGFGWLLRVDYRASTATRVLITTGDVHTTVALPPGSHQVQLPADAEYDEVDLQALDTPAELCVEHVAIGSLNAVQ